MRNELNLNKRLRELESRMDKAHYFGTITAKYSNGKTKSMLWVDAMEKALTGEIAGVTSENPIDEPVIRLINQAILSIN